MTKPKPGTLKLTIETSAGPVTIGTLAAGRYGTDQTTAALLAVIQDAHRHEPRVHTIARATSTPRGFFAWCRKHITFRRDPDGHEYIRAPGVVIAQIQRTGGAAIDCDDLTALSASVLAALGYVPVVVVIGRVPRELAGRFEHVLAGYLRDPGRPPTHENIVPFDPQETTELGTWPKGRMVRVTLGTEEHAA